MATIIQIGGSDLPKEPSELSFGMADISGEEAGRVKNSTYKMYKMRIGECHTISIAWNNPSDAEIAAILQMFKDEYLQVTYTDPYTNTSVTREFYRGDITAPIRYWWTSKKRYTRIEFNLIEREVHTN